MLNKQKKLFIIIILLAITIFLLLNVFVAGLEKLGSTSLDLTAENLYKLSDTTIDVVKSIPDDTTIYVLSNKDNYPVMLREIISRYNALSSNIQVKYIDPERNPLFLEHYRGLGYTIDKNDILVEGSIRTKAVTSTDFVKYDEYGNPTSLNPEQHITSAILYVNNFNSSKIYFTLGHNERISNSLRSFFQDNNYDIIEGTLTEALSKNPQIIVIAGPNKDFTTDECAKLERYVNSGGNIMLFIEPSNAGFSELEKFEQKYNILQDPGIIMEPRAFAGNNPVDIIPMYMTHTINLPFADNKTYVVMPSAAPLKILKNSNTSIITTPLLTTTKDSYVKTDLNYIDSSKINGDISGPFYVAAITETEEGKLFVCGSREVYSDRMLSTDSYANAQFLTYAVNYITDKEDTFTIPSKNLTSQNIVVQKGTSTILGILFVGVLPLIVAAIGITVRRRRKCL